MFASDSNIFLIQYAQLKKASNPGRPCQVKQFSIVQPLLLRPLRVLARMHDRRGDFPSSSYHHMVAATTLLRDSFPLWTLPTRRHRRSFPQRPKIRNRVGSWLSPMRDVGFDKERFLCAYFSSLQRISLRVFWV